MDVANRLKSERERLGLNQPQFAELASVGKTTVINWEKGASSPNAVQLSALASAGVDVLYVVTGQRSQPIPAKEELSPRQKALLDHYDNTDADGKKVIESTAFFAAESIAKGKKAA